MTTSGQDDLRQQNNYGDGLFVGRDNNGVINNVLLDPRTRSTLTKLSKDAPELADILKKALRDGIISPEAVTALQSAVRNINEDVAYSLRIAGQNINEDVAYALRAAGQNINEDVANRFVWVKDELNGTARELNSALDSLRDTVMQVSSLQGMSDPSYQFEPPDTVNGTARRTARVTTQASSTSADKWLFRLELICWSSGAGLLTATILTRTHLGTYAILAAVFMLLFAVVRRARR